MKQLFFCENGMGGCTITDDENFAIQRGYNYRLATLAELNENLYCFDRFEGILLTSDGICQVIEDGEDEMGYYHIEYVLLDEIEEVAVTAE